MDLDIVDFVGYGKAADEFEGTSPTGNLSSTKSAIRSNEGVDTDNNGVDFIVADVNPRSGAPVVVVTECAIPTASVAPAAVALGTQVVFTSSTSNAVIEYNTTAADAVDWIQGDSVTITSDTTYYVRATKAGLTTSGVATFAYTINMAEKVSIATAKAAALGTQNIKVEGVITYVKKQNVYIQDETGAICLYLNANATGLNIGDKVSAIGTRAVYGNLIELSNIDQSAMVVISTGNETPNVKTATLSELVATPEGKTAGYDYMCEIVKVNGASIKEVDSKVYLSQNGVDLLTYPKLNYANYPGVAAGDVVNVTLRMYDFNGTLEAEVTALAKVKLNLSASVAPGSVVTGTSVGITCDDANATIYYTDNGIDPTVDSSTYSGPLTVAGAVGDIITIKAFAKVAGKSDSDMMTYQYTIKAADAVPTIKEVLALLNNTANTSVIGQLAYFSTNNNPVIESVIDGQVYALYIFGAAPSGAKIGDTVTFKGTYTIYNGLPELASIVASSIVGSAPKIQPETMTIAEIKATGLSKLGHFVKISDVTLGTLNATGNTLMTDATGTINLYKGPAYPNMVVAGDVVDLYAMVACYNSTVQLYMGTSVANGFNVYDVKNDTKAPSITLADSYLNAKANQDYTIAVTAVDNKGIANVTMDYTVGGTQYTNQPMTLNAVSGQYEVTIPAIQMVSTASSIDFTVKATDVTGLVTTSALKTIVVENKPQVLSVSPARGISTGDVKAPLIQVMIENGGTNPSVTLTLKKNTTLILDNQVMINSAPVTYSYQTATLEDGPYSAIVTIVRGDGQTTTEQWPFTIGTPKYQAYFGQLHAHTAQYSDGSGTLACGTNQQPR